MENQDKSPDSESGDGVNAITTPQLPAAEPASEPTPEPAAPPKKPKRRIDQKDFPDKPRYNPSPTPATIENVKHMLDQNGIEVRYNLIKKKHEIFVPEDCGTLDNRDATAMAKVYSLASLNGIATGSLQQYVEALGDLNAYNPIADWIRSKPWDGIDRIVELTSTITFRNDYPAGFGAILVRKWLLSSVAAAMMKSEFRTRGVLVLQGPQSMGKTSWVQQLVPVGALREAYVKVDHHLDTTDKDSVLGAITHWLVELGELDSSFKKDVARLKGFLTSSHDKVRRPYGRVEAEYPRRTVFIATVNEYTYLVDTTGNSRWWTVAVDKLDYTHNIDTQQVFAQLAVEHVAGAQWWLTPEEEVQLDAINALHQSPSVIEELIRSHFDMALVGTHGLKAKTPSELLRAMGFDKPANSQAKECGAILRRLLGDPKRINGADKWRIPGTFSGDKGLLDPVSDTDSKWAEMRRAASPS